MDDIRDKDTFLNEAFPRNRYEILPFFSKTADILKKTPSTHYIFIVSPQVYEFSKGSPSLKEVVLESVDMPEKVILVAKDKSHTLIPSEEITGDNPHIVISIFS